MIIVTKKNSKSSSLLPSTLLPSTLGDGIRINYNPALAKNVASIQKHPNCKLRFRLKPDWCVLLSPSPEGDGNKSDGNKGDDNKSDDNKGGHIHFPGSEQKHAPNLCLFMPLNLIETYFLFVKFALDLRIRGIFGK